MGELLVPVDDCRTELDLCIIGKRKSFRRAHLKGTSLESTSHECSKATRLRGHLASAIQALTVYIIDCIRLALEYELPAPKLVRIQGFGWLPVLNGHAAEG